MKPLFRITMSMACLALLLWGGVAVPAETPPCPENCEYLMNAIEGYSCPESCEYMMKVVEEYPGWGVADVVACDQMDAATARAASCREEAALPEPEPIAAWQAYYLGVPEPVPAPGTHEYVMAMETGTLPSKPLVPFAVVTAFPEPGTWEYSQAMETGELPSMCGDVPCAKEEFTIVEVGTLRYRQGIDDGGGGEGP